MWAPTRFPAVVSCALLMVSSVQNEKSPVRMGGGAGAEGSAPSTQEGGAPSVRVPTGVIHIQAQNRHIPGRIPVGSVGSGAERVVESCLPEHPTMVPCHPAASEVMRLRPCAVLFPGRRGGAVNRTVSGGRAGVWILDRNSSGRPYTHASTPWLRGRFTGIIAVKMTSAVRQGAGCTIDWKPRSSSQAVPRPHQGAPSPSSERSKATSR